MNKYFTVNRIARTVFTIKAVLMLAVILCGGYFYTKLIIDTNNKAMDNYCKVVSEQLADLHARVK